MKMPRSESKLIQELRKLSPVDNIIMPDDLEAFCLKLQIGTQKFSFEGRQFLKQILKDDNKTIVVLKSRQVGYSVLIAALIAYNALTTPGIQILYCTDTFSHMKYFSKFKLKQFLQNAGLKLKKEDGQIQTYSLPNGSNIFLVSAYDNFTQARSYAIDILVLDEAQSLPLDSLINISEVLSQSNIGRTYIGGTGGFAGSSWENLWNSTSRQAWQDGKWIKQNPEGDFSGYHITQRMMPNWSQEDEDAKRLQSDTVKFSMEVEGRFVSGMEVPLPYSVAIQCFTEDAFKAPSELTRQGKIIASLDLAAGGDADTVLTISRYNEGMVHVVFAENYDDQRASVLFDKINNRLQEYAPDKIASDAGGNNELLYLLNQAYEVTSFRHSASKENIIYKEGKSEITINKSFFTQKAISRFTEHLISIPTPDPNWLIDQLTSETAETVHSALGGSSIRFGKLPNRKDDFLQSLIFLEAMIYADQDDDNPNNFKYSVSF